jgi:hypothetical protein
LEESDQLREENLNVMLAELLNEKGLKALGEVILRRSGRRPEPDVLVILNGVRIVIEGKKEGMWKELERQCHERLDNNVCDLCVMVEYVSFDTGKMNPTQLQIKEALQQARFNVGFTSYLDRANLDRWTGRAMEPREYRDVKFDDLLTYLMSAYSEVVSGDIIGPVVDKLQETLNQFATSLASTVNVDRLKDVMELREKEGGEGSEE